MLRVCHLNSQDITGGAARAANRLFRGEVDLQIGAQFYSQTRKSDETRVYGPVSKFGKALALLRPELDKLPTAFFRPVVNALWSANWLPFPLVELKELQKADIVHLHWICEGFIPIPFLKKINKPLVWTLHDMWPFTGGCHYAGDCERYQQQCGRCPQLGSSREKDLSFWVWNRKFVQWRDLDLTIVTPSNWLAECARQSSLFGKRRIDVIPNGIDTELYKPLNKAYCRDLLQVPQDRALVLFGAMNAASDQRKGFQYLQPALHQLAGKKGMDLVELLVFGSSAPSNPPNMGFPSHYLGRLHDDITMAVLYSAADVVVTPSTEDNLPNVVMESLACGTPCVAFDIGGMSDMIKHQKNGYLAKPFKPEGLAEGLNWVLDNKERLAELSHNARKIVESEYAIVKIAGRYKSLYEELLAR